MTDDYQNSDDYPSADDYSVSTDTFVLLSLGSNLGNRKININNAVRLLRAEGALKNIKLSGLYETEPVGYTDQPWFLNAAASGLTSLSMHELIRLCKEIEFKVGRKTRERWHEREIDIDILLYGDEILSDEEITIPHPRMHERRFVLEPAAEIAPELMHPNLNKTVEQLLEECSDNSVVKKYVE